MQFVMTSGEKRRQRSLPYQLWRVAVLSLRFMRLTRLGCAAPRQRA
jgi:hypothetical protein